MIMGYFTILSVFDQFVDFNVFSVTVSVLGSFVGAMLITMVAIPVIIKLSARYNLMDKPNQRKMHKNPIPTLGGAGFFLGFILISLFWIIFKGHTSDLVLFASMLVLFVMGIFDDLKDLSAKFKFMVQSLVALLIAFFGYKIESLNGIFGIYQMHPVIQYAFTVFLVVGLVNAFNLIDGIDGLAGGLAFINSMAMGTILLFQDNVLYSLMAYTFAGALLGFLVFNFNPAKIFMGDTGSLIVGFLMALFGIVVIKGGYTLAAEAPAKTASFTVVIVGIMLLPVYDTLRVFTERILKKKSPFSPDKTHVHHLLIETGADHKKAAIILYSANIAIIVLAFIFRYYPPTFSIPFLFIIGAIFSESINIKRLLIELRRGKQAAKAIEDITDKNQLLDREL